MELFLILTVIVLVPLVVASIMPTITYIRQKQRIKSGVSDGNMYKYEYTFSSKLVNHNLESGNSINSVETPIAFNTARNRGWIRGSSHVMSAEEFDQKRASEFSLQLP